MNREGVILPKNILLLFLDKLMAFPLWVKQIIYLRLYQDLSSVLSEDFIKLREEDIFHLYSPFLTYMGRAELSEKKGGYDANIYNFLANVAHGLNMLEISMNNFWTMEEVAKYYIFCVEQSYVKPAESSYVLAMAGFMAGKYRTGEYFKRVGKIDVDQLEKTIIKQREFAEKGTPLKMAEIMISLGFITEKDTTSLLYMKEEAKKRFILDSSVVPAEVPDKTQDLQFYQTEVEKLAAQNEMLKDRLTRVLEFVKKNG
mgnify:CR=1 FL=1